MSGSKTEQLSKVKDHNKIQKYNYAAQSGMTIETNIDNDVLQISESGQAAYAMSQEQKSQYEAAANEFDTDGELKIYEELKESESNQKIIIMDESVEIA